ncbi:hypothetical protein QFC19_007769, partial [Naganishia cerealis]
MVLPEGQDVKQVAMSRRGGGPVWKTVPYQKALQCQQSWLENRWCMDKIRNEFVGDKQLEQSSGAAATAILECRQKVLEAYTKLITPYLIGSVEYNVDDRGCDLSGAKLAYSKVDALINHEEAERLKEVNCRVSMQVYERPDGW